MSDFPLTYFFGIFSQLINYARYFDLLECKYFTRYVIRKTSINIFQLFPFTLRNTYLAQQLTCLSRVFIFNFENVFANWDCNDKDKLSTFNMITTRALKKLMWTSYVSMLSPWNKCIILFHSFIVDPWPNLLLLISKYPLYLNSQLNPFMTEAVIV